MFNRGLNAVEISCSGAFVGVAVVKVNRVLPPFGEGADDMKRKSSPPISPELAGHIRYLVVHQGLYQHQAAALCGVNQGRVSEVMRGYRHPTVPPAQGAFPF